MTAKGKTKVYTVKNPIDLMIDPGNGKTAVVGERMAPILFPSVIQRVEDVRLDGRGSQGFTIHIERKNGTTDEYQDRRSWAVGETAMLLPGLKTRITTKDRIGSEYQLVLILAATARALAEGIESSSQAIKVTVNWTLNTPPLYYGSASKLYDLAGEYRIEYNRKTYEIAASVAWVFPEGAGAFGTYALDDKGRFAVPTFLEGRTGIIDAGYRTIDSAIFQTAILLENTAHSLTNSISGVYQLMQQWAMSELGEDWSEDECETNIRNGYVVLRESKERIDLSEWIDDLGSRLADVIDSDILQKQWNGLGDVDRVLLAGGVAYMVAPHLKGRYPNALHLREEYPHAANVGYEVMNVVGHWRLLLAERAAAK
jgi:hypothetical protein